MLYILVGLSGALGAVLRYLISILFFANSIFPFATLTVNLLGSFLLAWLTTVFFKKISASQIIVSAIGTGFVGSFTTFSALSVETVELFKAGYIFLGIVYVVVSILGGLVMSRLGFKVSKEVEKI